MLLMILFRDIYDWNISQINSIMQRFFLLKTDKNFEAQFVEQTIKSCAKR